MVEKKSKPLTFSTIVGSGFCIGVVAIFVLLVFMDWKLDDFLKILVLPFPEVLWLLPLTFFLTVAPCYWLTQRPIMKEINKGTNNQLFKFKTWEMAVAYAVNCPFEELFFRVCIQGILAQYFGIPSAILITSSLFFLVHIRYIKYWQMMFSSVWVALVWGTVYALTESWLLVGLTHFFHNFILSSIEAKKANRV